MAKSKWKPLKVLFVGDQPSSKNVDSDLPFVGTPSYKRLLQWVAELDLDIRRIQFRNAYPAGCVTIKELEFDAIVFLGKKSECPISVIKYGYPSWQPATFPKRIVTDHPSPRNRKFNDPAYEKKMLKKLKGELYA